MFTLNSQLSTDCHQLGMLGSCHVLLHKNALLHWFILVPETQHTQLLCLEQEALDDVMAQAKVIQHYLTEHLSYKKTNVASIGNIVEQLHLHIIGRSKDDVCWPQPVWGNITETKHYHPDELAQISNDLLNKTV